MRIVLDTNAVISALSRKLNFQKILLNLSSCKYNLYITNSILLEYEEKIKLFFNNDQYNRFIDLLDLLPNVYKIEIYYNLNLISEDFTDNKFVDCAFACNANYIVSNDKHFNVLKSIEYPKIKVISIEEFCEILN